MASLLQDEPRFFLSASISTLLFLESFLFLLSVFNIRPILQHTRRGRSVEDV